MAVALTGTQEFIGSSSNSGSSSVTVPSDATAVLIYWVGWESGSNISMSSLSVGGNAMTILQNLARSGDADAVGGAILVNPPTGSQTFAWDWTGTGALGDGGGFIVSYVKGLDTSDPVRDSDVSAASDGSEIERTLTLTTNSTDLVIGIASSYATNANGAPGSSGQTIALDNQSFNNVHIDLAYETGGASTTAFSGIGAYGTLVAVALKVSAASGAISGTASATSSAVGVLTGAGAILGLSNATSAAAGSIVGSGSLAVVTSSAGAASGTLTGAGSLSGASSASASASSTLAGTGALSGTASSVANASGDLINSTPNGDLVGSASATSFATGTLFGIGALSGSATALSGASGVLSGSGSLSGLGSATSSAVGLLKAVGALIGLASAIGAASGRLLDLNNPSLMVYTVVFGSRTVGKVGFSEDSPINPKYTNRLTHTIKVNHR